MNRIFYSNDSLPYALLSVFGHVALSESEGSLRLSQRPFAPLTSSRCPSGGNHECCVLNKLYFRPSCFGVIHLLLLHYAVLSVLGHVTLCSAEGDITEKHALNIKQVVKATTDK